MIEGEKDRQGWLLHVSPAKPELPILRRADFRVTEKTWAQALKADALAALDLIRDEAKKRESDLIIQMIVALRKYIETLWVTPK
jgi:hypothetical protein